MRTQIYILLFVVLLICKSISAQKIPEWFFTQEPNCAAGISLPVTDSVIDQKMAKETKQEIVKEYALLCAQLTNAIIGGNASFFGEVTRDNEGIFNVTGIIEMKLAKLKDIEYIHYIGDSICLLYARFDTTYTDTMYIKWEKKELNIHDYIYMTKAMTSNDNRFITIESAYIIDRMSLFCSLGLNEYMVYGAVLVDKSFKDLFTTEYLNVNNGACELLRKLLFLNPISYISPRNGIDFGHSGFIPEITKLENATISSYGMYSCENYKLSVLYIPHGTSQFEIVIK